MDKATPEVSEGFSTDSIEDPIYKQQQLKLLHYHLMAIYVYAIQAVAAGPRRAWTSKLRAGLRYFLKTNPGGDTLQPYRRGPITRALVESHVKAKLRELRTTYAQIEQSVLGTDTTGSFQGWLRDTQDSLARFSATLTVMSFARRVIAAVWPLAIALAVVGTVWNTIFRFAWKLNIVANLPAIAVIVAAYVGGGLTLAVRSKREFFLKSISISPGWTNDSQDGAIGGKITAQNVYKAENELFDCIGRSKRREPALDVYLGGTIFLIFLIYQILDMGQHHDWGDPLRYMAIVSFILVASILIPSGLRRTMR